MRQLIWVCLVASAISYSAQAPAGSYLFVWAGDRDRKASDFLGVIDANPDKDVAQALEEIGRLGSRSHVRFGDDLDERHAAAVVIDVRRAIGIRKPLMQ